MRENALDVGHATILDEALHSTADHGVLAHEDNGLAAEGDTDFVHLLRCDIVDRDDEDALVCLKKRLQLFEVSALGCVLALLHASGRVGYQDRIKTRRRNWRTPIVANV
jgi:hypothetical protein